MTITKHGVLVVDDDERIVRAIDRTLRRAGYDVDTLLDARAITVRVQETRPALVLTDAYMPELDGFEVARSVLGLGLATQVVLMTGFVEPIRVLDAYQAGVSDFLPKVVLNEELLGVVERACQRYERWHVLVTQSFLSRAAVAELGTPPALAKARDRKS